MAAASPGSPVTVALNGIVGASITGLGSGAVSMVAGDLATGRAIRLARPTGSEPVLGVCDSSGNLTLSIASWVGTSPIHVFNIAQFGAIPNDSSSGARAANSAAIEAAITASSPDGFVPPFYWSGGTIHIPEGVWYLNDNVNIRRHLVLEGVGGVFGRSVLQFAPGKSLIVHASTTSSDGGDGVGSAIRSLKIRSDEAWNMSMAGTVSGDDVASTGTAGVKLNRMASLVDVCIEGFSGTGIEIIADASATPSTNANGWRVTTCWVGSCGGHGMHVDGGDSNQGVSIALYVVNVAGDGICESSFLGCTHIVPEVDACSRRAYFSSNAGSSLFLSPYAEQGVTGPSVFGHLTTVLGTTVNTDPSSQGWLLRWKADVRPFHVYNPRPGTGAEVIFNAGVDDVYPIAWGYQTREDSYYFSHRWYSKEKAWSHEWAASSIYRAYWLTGAIGSTQHARGAGKFGVNQLLLGSPGSNVEVHASATSPSGAGSVGDIVFNSSPSPGGYVGWVCTVAGWKGFGAIDV